MTLLVENHDLSYQAASNLNLETSIETLKDSIVLCRELQTFNQDCTKAKTHPSPCPRAWIFIKSYAQHSKN